MQTRPLPYLLILCVGVLAGFLYGYDLGITSAAILYTPSTWHSGMLQTGLLASSVFAGATLATTWTGKLSNHFGRRFTLRIGAAIAVAGLLLIVFTHSLPTTIVGRLIEGMGIGMGTILAPVYLTECIPSHWRGKAILGFQIGITCAIVIAHGLAAYRGHAWQWHGLMASILVPSFALLIGTCFIPPSPHWLEQKKQHPSQSHTRFEKHEWRAMVFVVLLASCQQLTGVNAILQFGPHILLDTGLHNQASSITVFGSVGLINCLMTWAAIPLVDRVGRRRLLLLGAIGMGIACLFLALCWQSPHLLQAKWVLLGLGVFIACFAIGPGAVMWTVMPELLPQRARSTGLSMAILFSSLAAFLGSLSFMPLAHHIGYTPCFLFLSCMCWLTYYLAKSRLPETSGQSLQDIEKTLKKHYANTPS